MTTSKVHHVGRLRWRFIQNPWDGYSYRQLGGLNVQWGVAIPMAGGELQLCWKVAKRNRVAFKSSGISGGSFSGGTR